MINKQLLLAEDDEMLAALLNFRLTKEGYTVRVSNDGRQLKEQIDKQMPDAIITDIMMPYFSGMELISYVRKDLDSKIPIIVISSAGNEENVTTAFQLGANDFISKPVSPSELIIRLQKELANV